MALERQTLTSYTRYTCPVVTITRGSIGNPTGEINLIRDFENYVRNEKYTMYVLTVKHEKRIVLHCIFASDFFSEFGVDQAKRKVDENPSSQ